MQKRIVQEFVLEGQEIAVGLEDSKKTWKLCVRSGGVIVHETSMPAKYDVLRAYFKNKFPKCRIRVIYEAGFSGFSLHDELENDGWKCIVTPPHTVTQEKCQLQKNDRIDSRRLAKNLENNDYRKCFVPTKKVREDRQISRVYRQVQKDIVRTRNRIRRMLEFHGFDKYFIPGTWYEKEYQLVEDWIKETELSKSIKFSFEILFKELHVLREFKKNIIKELKTLAKSDTYKKQVELLESAPGIGFFTAIRLALEWGEMGRFNTKEKFANFLGLTPSEYSTGERERKGHITKQGNRGVRAWLIEAAWVAIKKDPVLLNKFQRVIKNSGSKKKAIVAVARKLAIRLRTVLLSEKPYVIGVVV